MTNKNEEWPTITVARTEEVPIQHILMELKNKPVYVTVLTATGHKVTFGSKDAGLEIMGWDAKDLTVREVVDRTYYSIPLTTVTTYVIPLRQIVAIKEVKG